MDVDSSQRRMAAYMRDHQDKVVGRWTDLVLTGLSLVDQTKVVTAASELARNALVHGGTSVVVVKWSR